MRLRASPSGNCRPNDGAYFKHYPNDFSTSASSGFIFKNMISKTEVKWLNQPEDHDYPAAVSYLSLIYPVKTAQQFAEALKQAPITQFKAKDIFRASALKLLDATNYHVKKNIKLIESGSSLSPIILVRDTSLGKVLIADGYHRVCAVYTFDEDAVIPSKIV